MQYQYAELISEPGNWVEVLTWGNISFQYEVNIKLACIYSDGKIIHTVSIKKLTPKLAKEWFAKMKVWSLLS